MFLLVLCFQIAKRGPCMCGCVGARLAWARVRALCAGPVGTVAAQNGLWVITGVQAVLCCGRNDRTDAHLDSNGWKGQKKGEVGKNNSSSSNTTCASESPELGRVTAGCLAVAARKYWSQSTSESSSIDRAAGVRRAVYRLRGHLCYGFPHLVRKAQED